MTDQHPIRATVDPDCFQANFAAIAPLILTEWPAVSKDSLMATAGELEPVVDCVAAATDHTRLLIRHQLRELCDLATLKSTQSQRSRFSERLSQRLDTPLTESDVKHTLDLLEARTEELLQQFKQDVLPDLNEKVRKNVGGSLLTVLGIGFVLGLLMGGRRGR